MPCRDGYDYTPPISYEGHLGEMNKIRKRLDAATRAACEAFTCIEDEFDTVVKHKMTDFVSVESANWWTQHQEEDKIRKETLKKSAYEKLTPEEREVLGL